MGLVKLYAAANALEAHHLRGHLVSQGIRATVMGESLGAGRGELPMTAETLPSVHVDREDADRAMEVVQQWLAVESVDAEAAELGSWVCPSCGEAIEGQFDACWQCGATRSIGRG